MFGDLQTQCGYSCIFATYFFECAGNQEQPDISSSHSSNTSQVQTSPNSSSLKPKGTSGSQGTTSVLNQASKQTLASGASQQTVSSSSRLTELQPPSFFANSPTLDTRSEPVNSLAMALNYKQLLHIHCQKNHLPVAYECSSSEDAVGYIVTIKVSEQVFESSLHGTKRAAEDDAAEKAMKSLGIIDSQIDQQQAASGPTLQGKGVHPLASLVSQSQSEFSDCGYVTCKVDVPLPWVIEWVDDPLPIPSMLAVLSSLYQILYLDACSNQQVTIVSL